MKNIRQLGVSGMALYSAEINEKGQVVLSGGQIINNIHADNQCLGEHCPLHNPTAHSYRDLPLVFNGVNMVRKVSKNKFVIDPDDYNFSQNGSAILKNSAKCLKCNETLNSKSRHDFNQCSCGNVFVDGGLSYIRRGVKDSEFFEDLSEVVEKENFDHSSKE